MLCLSTCDHQHSEDFITRVTENWLAFFSFCFEEIRMKFSIVPLEERIAPSRGPVQQAIVAGGGKGSKGGAGLTMAQQSLGGGGGSPWQQAIVAGGGNGSKGGVER